MGVAKTNFYHDEPFFGLDIGNSSVKVMQIETEHNSKPRITGYGVSSFYPVDTIQQGIITKLDVLSLFLNDVLKSDLQGTITTRRVVCTIPTAHTFSRLMNVPLTEEKEIVEAVKIEAEQYIPMPIDKLYMDYEVTQRNTDSTEVLLVATPKDIVDSYVNFLESVELEPVALEPSMNSAARLLRISNTMQSEPAILLDFGSVATDIAIIDKALVVNSTVPAGSDILADLIAKKFNLSRPEAMNIKSNMGIGYSDKQQEIMSLAQPMLDGLVKEVRKVLRYYGERSAQKQQKITKLILNGGGSTMPGLSEYLASALELKPQILDPWNKIDFGKLTIIEPIRKTMYLTVTGAAMLSNQETIE